jgi:phytoene desaturase (3,4-didehydrolycopene-forming)
MYNELWSRSPSSSVAAILATVTQWIFCRSVGVNCVKLAPLKRVPFITRLGAASNESLSHLSPHVIVVGGGVGGLAVAARIAASHKISDRLRPRVTILEKNIDVGGRCGSFYHSVSGVAGLDVFRHERGPTLLLLPKAYRDLFLECNRAEETSVEESKVKQADEILISSTYNLYAKQCVPAYRVVFDDGDMVDLGFPRRASAQEMISDAEKKSRRQLDRFEENGAQKWDVYQRACSAFLNCGLPNFIEERLDLSSLPEFLLESLRDGARAWPLKPHSDVLQGFFSSAKMRALASFQDLYVGLEPYRNPKQPFGGIITSTAPAVFGLLSALELHPTNPVSGVYSPVGGFDAVTHAMKSLCIDLGVDIKCSCSVTAVSEEGVYYRETGENDFQRQEPHRTFLAADAVVINADLPYATKTMLNEGEVVAPNVGDADRYDWDTGYRYSSGVVAFHWSISKELSELNTHNVFLSAATDMVAEQSWQSVRGSGHENVALDLSDKPFNFYVHRACASDPSAAPLGSDTLLVLVPTESLFYNATLAKLPRRLAIASYCAQFDADRIARIRQAVLKRMAALPSLQDLESHIVSETVDTPGTYADQYNVAAGTPFGLSHGLGQLSVTRPAPCSNRFPNVFFVGASTRPGNGVPLVLIGAKLVAENALQHLLKEAGT